MILFTGRGTSGSWQCRGVQLGGEIGIAKPKATIDDMRAADAIVLVKRPSPGMIDTIRKSGRPWFWDVVDCYPQPECTSWPKQKAVAWVKQQILAFRPNGIIWPNQRMREDCGSGERSCVVYHHHRPGIRVNPLRDRIESVGYEGSPKYLGWWGKRLKRICKDRGWTLHVNDGVHADWDLCVGFRDKAFNGYAQYHWKSNVKLANCHGSGTPFIGAREDGYLETQTGFEGWCDDPKYLDAEIDRLSDIAVRREAHAAFLKSAYSVTDAARDLKAFLDDR